jgi:hypothetical protein
MSSDIATVCHCNGKEQGIFFIMFLGIAAVTELLSHSKPAPPRNLKPIFLLQFNVPQFTDLTSSF